MARERIHAPRLHPDVVTFLEGIAVAKGYRSLAPAIEFCVKTTAKVMADGKLDHVKPGEYGIEEQEIQWHGSADLKPLIKEFKGGKE